MIKNTSLSFCHICGSPSLYLCTDCNAKLCQECSKGHKCQGDILKVVEQVINPKPENKMQAPENVKPVVMPSKRKRQ